MPRPTTLDVPLSLASTVNEVLVHAPELGAYFVGLGVDTCCGGTRSLAEAGAEAKLDPAVLLAHVQRTLAGT